MDKNKIIIIIAVVLGIIEVAVLILPNLLGEYKYKKLYADVDIEIKVRGGGINAGGYAQVYTNYHIDIEKKKIYKVKNYYVFGESFENGEKGSHYLLEKTRDLTDEEIHEILELIDVEVDENVIPMITTQMYFVVLYDDKFIGFKYSELPIVNKIISQM